MVFERSPQGEIYRLEEARYVECGVEGGPGGLAGTLPAGLCLCHEGQGRPEGLG